MLIKSNVKRLVLMLFAVCIVMMSFSACADTGKKEQAQSNGNSQSETVGDGSESEIVEHEETFSVDENAGGGENSYGNEIQLD